MSHSKDQKQDQLADYVLEIVRLQGAAAVQVRDGHVFAFTREKLQSLLDQHGGAILSIFVRQGAGDGSVN